MNGRGAQPRSRFLVWLAWSTGALVVSGVAAYLIWKPAGPMADPKAVQALALVKTHPARSAPSIREAIDAVMQANQKPDRSPSIGDWTVRSDEGTGEQDSYRVRVVVRLPGDQINRWIEWEYLWMVRLSSRTVVPLSRPAVEIMP